MDSKMITVVLCLVSAVCTAALQSTRHHAGGDPNPCYDYSDCGNSYTASRAKGTLSSSNAFVYATDGTQYGVTEKNGAGAAPGSYTYPAGVDPSACPNYPFCGPTPVHVPNKESTWTSSKSRTSWPSAPSHGSLVAPATPNAQNSWVAPTAAPSYGPFFAPTTPSEPNSWVANSASSRGPFAAPAAPSWRINWVGPTAPSHGSFAAPVTPSTQTVWDSSAARQSWSGASSRRPTPKPYVAQGTWSESTEEYAASAQDEADDTPAQGGARYPADLDPNSCPNYPYCH